MDAISSPLVALELRQRFQRERVAKISFGDSNRGRTNSSLTRGYDWYMQRALFETHAAPCWGVQFLPGGEMEIGSPPTPLATTPNLGFRCEQNNNNTILKGAPDPDVRQSGAPSPQWQRLPGLGDQNPASVEEGLLAVNGYARVLDGKVFTASTGGQTFGIKIDLDHPIGTDQALKAIVAWSGELAGSGSFRPIAKEGGTPGFATIAQAPTIATNTGDNDLKITTLDMPVTSAGRDLKLNMIETGGTLPGPFLLYWLGAVNPAVTTGVCETTHAALGGWSLRDLLLAIGSDDQPITGGNGQTDEGVGTLLDILATEVGPSKTLWVSLNFAINDVNDAGLSLGPVGGLVSSTPAGFGDNLRGVMNRIKRIAEARGWTVFFDIVAGHPRTINDAPLAALRAEAATVANDYNAFATDLSVLYPAAEILADGGYEDGLTEAGQAHQLNSDVVGYGKSADLLIGAIMESDFALFGSPTGPGGGVASRSEAASIALAAAEDAL